MTTMTTMLAAADSTSSPSVASTAAAAAPAPGAAISFTLPAFGPRLVALHCRTDDDAADASNGGDDDSERPPQRQVLGEAHIIVADDAEGAAPRNADQWRGKCVLFQRGKITFLEKVWLWCLSSSGLSSVSIFKQGILCAF
jgi:hypothetical protein